MICVISLRSGKPIECCKGKCPFWLRDEASDKMFCLHVSHALLDFILMRRALSYEEQNELMNKEIVDKKTSAYL